ncbi:YceD family protein [Pseudonocardia zijingensis]|uniref:YceD family protein n=1 Tax=Pseudonocardia zijingensis TaxID=153376 RepID=A0ABN1PTU6_9PSEU
MPARGLALGAYPGPVTTHHPRPVHPDPASPWVFATRELGRRPGNMRSYSRQIAAPTGTARLGLETIAVPEGQEIDLDVRLESVTEGVYVSGTVRAPLSGECARCLDVLADEVDVALSELFAYPDSVTDETTDADEVPRVVDELIDVEQIVRDAVVLALPLAPLCRADCPGLCPDCGEKWADLAPDHGHETLDPRWAALKGRLSAD